MSEIHLHKKAKIVGKEEEYFGTPASRKLPGNIPLDPKDIGEFGKERRPQRPKTYTQKLADKRKLIREAHAKAKENAYKRSGKKKMVVG